MELRSMQQNILVIGGTSGLGLELARNLKPIHTVIVTGRVDPKEAGVQFLRLDLSNAQQLNSTIDDFIATLPHVDCLIFAAGFFQEGRVSDLGDEDIDKMITVGLVAPTKLVQRLLKKQNRLSGFVAITSTSQWTPRLLEPVYTAVKSGLGMLANSLSLDENIGKVMVAAPAGMKTKFWDGQNRDLSEMLDPQWVAEQIICAYQDEFKYKFVRIMRGPARTEVVERR